MTLEIPKCKRGDSLYMVNQNKIQKKRKQKGKKKERKITEQRK